MEGRLRAIDKPSCWYPYCGRTATVELYGDGFEGSYCEEHAETALLLHRAGHMASSWFSEHANNSQEGLLLALAGALKGLAS